MSGKTKSCRKKDKTSINHGDIMVHSAPLTDGTMLWQKQSLRVVETQPEQERQSTTGPARSTSGLKLAKEPGVTEDIIDPFQ